VVLVENINLLSNEFESALLEINRIKAADIFNKCFQEKNSFGILENMAISTLERIGEGWENGNISLSQVYMSSIICEELIDRYLPKSEVKLKDTPKLAIAVLKDQHSLGKRIVYSILRTGGFEVLDLGQGLSVDDLVRETIDNHIEILLISTLMLPTALKVKEVKEKLIAQGANTKIIAGGAPFRLDSNLWKTVGADADGKNASTVVKTIERLWKGESK
jgi:methanogenic corrinoid protein MtbC1